MLVDHELSPLHSLIPQRKTMEKVKRIPARASNSLSSLWMASSPLIPYDSKCPKTSLEHGEHWSTSDEKEQVHNAILQFYIVTNSDKDEPRHRQFIFILTSCNLINCICDHSVDVTWVVTASSAGRTIIHRRWKRKGTVRDYMYSTTLLIDSLWQAFAEGWLQFSIRHRSLWSN